MVMIEIRPQHCGANVQITENGITTLVQVPNGNLFGTYIDGSRQVLVTETLGSAITPQA